MIRETGHIHLLITLTLIAVLLVFFSGCTGTSQVQPSVRSDLELSGNGEKDLPPMYNYPPVEEMYPDDHNPGIFHPGDILQTSPDSPLHEPDLGIIIIRDTGNGNYEVGGMVQSAGTWYRITGSEPGYVDHISIERSFPVVVGHGDYYSMPKINGPGSFKER